MYRASQPPSPIAFLTVETSIIGDRFNDTCAYTSMALHLSSNLLLQLSTGDRLEVGASSDEGLVDVDVRNSALSVELLEVRLPLA
jgi:hypothetical protein